MRSFDDFMSSFSLEEVYAIVDDANQKASEIRCEMDPNNPAFVGTQVGVISYTIAIELLGLYHKWLEEEHQGP